jgi:hypothetical protein
VLAVLRLSAPVLRPLERELGATEAAWKSVMGLDAGPAGEGGARSLAAGSLGAVESSTGFGTLYAGQEFSALVCVINHSSVGLPEAGLSAAIQFGEAGAWVPLADVRPASGAAPLGSAALLGPGEMVDLMVRTPIEQVGGYTLRVIATFQTPRGAAQIPRIFRFRAETALSGRVSVLPWREGCAVALQLQNETSKPLSVLRLALEGVGASAPVLGEWSSGGGAGRGEGAAVEWLGAEAGLGTVLDAAGSASIVAVVRRGAGGCEKLRFRAVWGGMMDERGEWVSPEVSTGRQAASSGAVGSEGAVLRSQAAVVEEREGGVLVVEWTAEVVGVVAPVALGDGAWERGVLRVEWGVGEVWSVLGPSVRKVALTRSGDSPSTLRGSLRLVVERKRASDDGSGGGRFRLPVLTAKLFPATPSEDSSSSSSGPSPISLTLA